MKNALTCAACGVIMVALPGDVIVMGLTVFRTLGYVMIAAAVVLGIIALLGRAGGPADA